MDAKETAWIPETEAPAGGLLSTVADTSHGKPRLSILTANRALENNHVVQPARKSTPTLIELSKQCKENRGIGFVKDE